MSLPIGNDDYIRRFGGGNRVLYIIVICQPLNLAFFSVDLCQIHQMAMINHQRDLAAARKLLGVMICLR